MRKVTYFSAGLLADFVISDQAFDKFLVDLNEAQGEIDRYGEEDLLKARTLLDNFMARAQQDQTIVQGTGEVLGASFIWNFFNTNPDSSRVITGDIVVVDLDGTLTSVEYASVNDLKFAQHDHDHDHDHAHGHGCGCGHEH
ncbi:hypothetical protein [Magnetovibrio sp.]|uniref:hypothetical protein n=1 Tax=Magnetovibrio sp. TaxID=2024836 RepID=UPI002F944373